MNWAEVKEKYSRVARKALGAGASEEEINQYVYRKVVDRACVTNPIFDQVASTYQPTYQPTNLPTNLIDL